MRKYRTKIASMLALLALALPVATGLHAQNIQTQTASAERVTDSLLSPIRYEEYLPLNAPTDLSVTDEFTAIADGNVVYIYDKTAAQYKKYVHSNVVTKIQLSEKNVLYVLDSENVLYTLNAIGFNEGVTANSTGIANCLTYTIYGEHLYYTTMSGFSTTVYVSPIANPAQKTQLFQKSIYCPSIAVYGDTLYYLQGEEHLHKYSLSAKTDSYVGTLPYARSIAVTETALVCTSTSGSFHVYDLSLETLTETTNVSGHYTALCIDDDNVYTIHGKTVKHFSLTSADFTNFEISSSSASTHRFNGAETLCFKDDRLFIADVGNSRISVYNTQTQAFEQPFTATLPPSFMLSDGETLLTASTEQAILYALDETHYGESATTLSSADIHGNIIGATEIYGSYYLSTDQNRLYTIQESDTGYTWTESQRTGASLQFLTSDVYGNAYGVHENDLYRYRESELSSPASQGELLIEDLPQNTENILIDYDRNVYALTGNDVAIYKQNSNGEYALHATQNLEKNYVYGVTPAVKNIAFSDEENLAYVLYEGDYLVQTSAFSLPSLRSIPCDNAQSLFDEATPSVQLTSIQKDALIVYFDIEQLKGATTYPYLSHERNNEEKTALLLGEDGCYNVLSIYNEETKKRESCLVLKSSCTPLAKENYQQQYETPKTGYIVSPSNTYKHPYLSKLFLADNLSGGYEVSVLSKVTGLETDYYEISYKNSEGNTVISYLPCSFVADFDGVAPETITQTYGNPDSDSDAIFRLVYILLGGFAICILVDFLLLRPRKKDDEEDTQDNE